MTRYKQLARHYKVLCLGTPGGGEGGHETFTAHWPSKVGRTRRPPHRPGHPCSDAAAKKAAAAKVCAEEHYLVDGGPTSGRRHQPKKRSFCSLGKGGNEADGERGITKNSGGMLKEIRQATKKFPRKKNRFSGARPTGHRSHLSALRDCKSPPFWAEKIVPDRRRRISGRRRRRRREAPHPSFCPPSLLFLFFLPFAEEWNNEDPILSSSSLLVLLLPLADTRAGGGDVVWAPLPPSSVLYRHADYHHFFPLPLPISPCKQINGTRIWAERGGGNGLCASGGD